MTSKMSLYSGVPNSTGVPSAAVASTTLSAGAFSSGGVVSSTVTCCVLTVLLLCSSVAVQVTVVIPTGNTSGALFSTVTSKMSLYSGVPNSTGVPSAAVASTTLSAGAFSSGGVVSSTVTCCVLTVLLLCSSVAVQVTVVIPTGNTSGALFSTVTSKMSLYSGVPNSTGVPSAAVASTTLSAGAFSSGGVVSLTIIRCILSVLLLCSSVAVQVTLVVPIGNNPGASFDTSTPKISLYTGLPISTGVPSAEVASTIKSRGASSSGGVVSAIVIF